MKQHNIYYILLLFSILSCSATDDLNPLAEEQTTEEANPVQVSDTIFNLNNDSLATGVLSAEALTKECGQLDWHILNDRASITTDEKRGKVMRVKYPQGGVGPSEGGIQFLKSIPASNEYYLDYYIKLEEGFDFRLGGKLPGLTSGGDQYTGGNKPTNGEGWSARYMWVKEGNTCVYLYYLDMTHEYGEPVYMDFQFEVGKWYRFTQHIKVNEDNQSNGTLQIWVNGTSVLERQDVRYRLWDKGLIDAFYFSTFFGGASEDWAPLNDSYALFDDITISKSQPKFTSND